MSACPNDEELEHFVDGRLAGAELAAIESHLSECEACRRIVAGALAAALEPEPAGEDESPARRGTVLGRYVLLEAIGAGAMGVVYRAYDPELDRRVAVKVLRRGDASDSQRERMLREAKSMAKVSSPYVVAVYDAGVLDDHVFIAMELVDGVTLAKWVSASPRAARDVVARFAQAGRGLMAAHQAGLIHRDFKPENVLVTKDDVAKVTDFGLARGLHAGLPKDRETQGPVHLAMTLSRTGSLMGTPAYMAPEQLLGKPIDERTDQFSFCVALFEALVGKRPFAGDTLESLRATVLAGKVDEALRLRAIPSELRRAVLRGLSVDPKARFATMRELVSVLDAYASSTRRRWLALAAIGGVAVMVLAARAQLAPSPGASCAAAGSAANAFWNEDAKSAVKKAFLATDRPYAPDAFRSADASLTSYADAWKAQRVDNCRATHVRAEQSAELFDLRVRCLDDKLAAATALAHTLATADAVVVDHAVEATTSLSSLAACKDTAQLRARVRLPSDPAVQASVSALRNSLEDARALGASGRYGEAETRAASVLGSARAISYEPLTAEALLLDGDLLEKTGDYKRAGEQLREAASTAIAARDDATASTAMIRLITVTGYRLSAKDEAALWDRMAEAELAARGDPSDGVVALEENRGALARSQGFYGDARHHLEKALLLQRQNGKKDDPDVAVLLADLGYTLLQAGEKETALDTLLECVAIRSRAFGSGHPLVAAAKSVLGSTYLSLDRLEEAMTTLREAEQIQRSTLGPDHVETGYTLNRIGNVYLSRGDYDLAREAHQRVLDLGVKALGSSHPEVGLAHMNLAIDLWGLGLFVEAEGELARSRAILEKALGPDYPFLSTVLAWLGTIRRDQHRLAEAKALHLQALVLAEKTLGPKHPDLSYMLGSVGKDFLAVGNAAEATAPLERALALIPPGTALGADIAEVKFALAQALWPDVAARSRALQLAQEAHTLYHYDSMRDRRERGRIESWLATHHV